MVMYQTAGSGHGSLSDDVDDMDSRSLILLLLEVMHTWYYSAE